MRNKIVILLSFQFILTMQSCTTINSFEKYTSDDCIIIIPIENIKPDDKKMARSYYLKISGIKHKITVPNESSDILIIKIRNSNHKIISLTSKVTNENFEGSSSANDMNLLLPYTPGEVVISNFKIIHKMEEVSENKYKSWAYMHPLTDKEKDEYSESITTNIKLKSWFD